MAGVRLEFDLAHPPVRVWRALTDAGVLAGWFMPTDLEPRPGSRFTLQPGTLPGFLGPIEGELLELAPPFRLVMLWSGEKLYTRVTWVLTPTPDGCRLTVVQTGFIGAPAALRVGSLRAVYTDLFGHRLPLALDRLAVAERGGGTLGHDHPGGPPPPLPWRAPAPPRPPTPPLPPGPWSLSAPGGSTDPGLRAGPPASPGPSPAHPPTAPPPTTGVPSPPARGGSPGGHPAAAGGPPALPAGPWWSTDPRQRRLHGNAVVGAWSSGRPLGPSQNQPPRSAYPTAGGVRADRDGNLRPAAPPAGPADRAAERPAWVRGLTLAATAAVLMVLVLATVAYQPNGGRGDDQRQTEAGAGPGMAVQPAKPTTRADRPATAAPPGAAAPTTGGGSSGSPDGPPDPSAAAPTGPRPTTPAAPGTTGPPAPPTAPEPSDPPPDPEPTPEPSTAPPPPELTADVTSTGLPLVGGRSVQVTVANPGPGQAEEWEVAMSIGHQDVTNVTGADYEITGSQVVFTPLSDELAAGEQVAIEFHLVAPLLGLLGGTDPTSCTIDGRPCV